MKLKETILLSIIFSLASFFVSFASATPSSARLIDETIRKVDYPYAEYEVVQEYDYDESEADLFDAPNLFSSSNSVPRSQLQGFVTGYTGSGSKYIVRSNASSIGSFTLENNVGLNGISYFGVIVPIDQLNLPHCTLSFSNFKIYLRSGGLKNISSGDISAQVMINNLDTVDISGYYNASDNSVSFSGDIEIFEDDTELKIYVFSDLPMQPVIDGGAYFEMPVSGSIPNFAYSYEPIVTPTESVPQESQTPSPTVSPTEPTFPGGGGSGGSSSSWLNSMSVNIQAMYKVLCTNYLSISSNDTFVIKDSDGDSYTFNWLTSDLWNCYIQNEDLVFASMPVSGSVPGIIRSWFRAFMTYLDANLTLWRNWFYPLKSDDPLYWRFFNTDTSKQENTNLAGVLYHISWYLGQMFQMNTWDLGDSGLKDSAFELDTTLKEFEKAESDLFDQVKDDFNSFIPDASEIGALRAIVWVSGYLQKVFVALGQFALPITVSLVLGVCMQFIGYFKYKS